MRSFAKFEFKVLTAFSAAVLVVFGLVVVNEKLAHSATQAVDAVAHTHEVLGSLARAHTDTLQVELSNQNFRLTGDVARLAERDAAIASREIALNQLKQLTDDNVQQHNRWLQLRAVLDERITGDSLQETHERTYRILREMESVERQLLARRLSDSLSARQAMFASGAVVAVMLFALLCAIYVFIRSQLRQTEESRRALATSEEGLSTTLNSIGDGVIATDTQARITRMNPVAEMLTGWSLADARGRPIEEVFCIVNEHTRAVAVVPVAEVLGSGEVHELASHTILIARDGSERPVSDSAAPIRDTQGQMSGVVLVFRDVSAERRIQQTIREQNDLLEQRIQERTQEVRDSNERYRTIFRTSPDAVTITRLSDGRYLDVNDGFLRLFGWTREEIIGKTSRDIGIWHNWGDRAALMQTMQRDGHCENMEAMFLTKDGRTVASQVSANVIDLGEHSCMLSVTHDITAHKRAQEQIAHLAFFNPITALPNRKLLMDRLEQAITASVRHQRLGVLVFVDLDDFKTLNETLGHEQGDLLLKQVARRLNENIRMGDTVAHIGGDEFVVLLEELNKNPQEAATQAKAVVEKMLAELDKPYQVGGGEHHSSSSMGITLFGNQAENTDEPLKRAELAMYQAKAAGRGKLRFFDPQMQAVVNARVAMEAGLREALEKGHFLLHYQPQLTDGQRVTGAEALIRWQDPRRGLVSPAEFIPLAEDSGLIIPLGHWVLEAACIQLAKWAEQPQMAQLTIAVNVSARQFYQDDFVAQVWGILERTGASATRLKLELTESLLVSNVEEVIAKMEALKGKGVGFSLDDFGTGYSSLSYLKRLPLDQLKIDQGFVREILVDPNDSAIAKMVIALADSMGLAVIAEGVETQAQCDFLAELGCRNYQGYLFSRPLPIQAFEAFMQQG